MPTDTFSITSDSADGCGYRQAGTWAGISAGTFFDDPGDILYTSKYVTVGGNFIAENSFLRFDTSTIPDTATVTAAVVKMYLNEIRDFFGSSSIEGEYYDFGGEPTVAADWALNVTAGIFTPVSCASLTTGAINNFTLTDLTGINLTGYTGFRFAISNITPVQSTLEVDLRFAAREHATGTEPQLEVTYTVEAPVVAWIKA